MRASKFVASNGLVDFSNPNFGPGGGITFSQFVANIPGGDSILARFNAIIEGLGGTPQPFATGTGSSAFSGLALVGENGPELVNFGNPAQIFSNEQSSALLNDGSGAAINEAFAMYARQSSEETTYLGNLLTSMLAEIRDMNDNIARYSLNS